MRDKKKKTNIKVNDLKPRKDAKGGVVANVSTHNSSSNRSIQSRQNNQANRQLHI